MTSGSGPAGRVEGPGRADEQGCDGRAAGPPAWPRPRRPRLAASLLYRVQPWLAPRPSYRRLAGWLAASRLRYAVFARAEEAAKSGLFGCRMCGQCALPATAYTCPMTCPKQLRNGPCGGVGADGSCEVHPGVRCVWLNAYERAEHTGRVADLRRLQRPVDHRRRGQSSWVNYWQGADDLLATADDGLGAPPGIGRARLPIIMERR